MLRIGLIAFLAQSTFAATYYITYSTPVVGENAACGDLGGTTISRTSCETSKGFACINSSGEIYDRFSNTGVVCPGASKTCTDTKTPFVGTCKRPTSLVYQQTSVIGKKTGDYCGQNFNGHTLTSARCGSGLICLFNNVPTDTSLITKCLDKSTCQVSATEATQIAASSTLAKCQPKIASLGQSCVESDGTILGCATGSSCIDGICAIKSEADGKCALKATTDTPYVCNSAYGLVCDKSVCKYPRKEYESCSDLGSVCSTGLECIQVPGFPNDKSCLGPSSAFQFIPTNGDCGSKPANQRCTGGTVCKSTTKTITAGTIRRPVTQTITTSICTVTPALPGESCKTSDGVARSCPGSCVDGLCVITVGLNERCAIGTPNTTVPYVCSSPNVCKNGVCHIPPLKVSESCAGKPLDCDDGLVCSEPNTPSSTERVCVVPGVPITRFKVESQITTGEGQVCGQIVTSGTTYNSVKNVLCPSSFGVVCVDSLGKTLTEASFQGDRFSNVATEPTGSFSTGKCQKPENYAVSKSVATSGQVCGQFFDGDQLNTKSCAGALHCKDSKSTQTFSKFVCLNQSQCRLTTQESDLISLTQGTCQTVSAIIGQSCAADDGTNSPCISGTCTKGLCVGASLLGGPCSSSPSTAIPYTCDSKFMCRLTSNTTGTCQNPPVGEFKPCSVTADCMTGLTCRGSTPSQMMCLGANTVVQFIQKGQDCTSVMNGNPSYRCVDGSTCQLITKRSATSRRLTNAWQCY